MEALWSIHPAWIPWLAGGTAFALSVAMTPITIRLAHRFGWIAVPTSERWHKKPTALMGGVAIFAATALTVLTYVGGGVSVHLWSGALLMFAVGVWDDLRRLPPSVKLLAQVIAAGLLLLGGYAFAPGWAAWLSVPLTFVWVIGVTNAVNLLDNMDGLAAGIVVIAAVFLSTFTALEGDATYAAVAAAVGGSALGFLIFNFNPARIFMGDGGSLFLGYSLAALSTVLHGEASRPVSLAYYLVPIAVLAVPIFDTTLVAVLRTLSGKPVSQGGRDHSSHRLVVAGLSERRAVLTLYAVSLVSAGLALYFLYADVAFFYALVIYLVVGMAVFGAYLSRTPGHQAEGASSAPLERIPAVFKFLMGRSWRVLMGMATDGLLFVAAFIVAFHFRFEEGLTPEREAFIMTALPIAIVVKLTVFYFMGMYRTMWRYAGTPEIVDVLKTTTTACLAAFGAVGIYFGFEGIAEGAFFIDWMIVSLSVMGTRLGYRGLHQYFASRRRGGRRVLIYGTGEMSLLALRVLRQDRSQVISPVGFLDDDTSKHGMTAQGLEVLGAFDDLKELCERHGVDELVVTVPIHSGKRLSDIAAQCRQFDIVCSRFNVAYESISEEEAISVDVKEDKAITGTP